MNMWLQVRLVVQVLFKGSATHTDGSPGTFVLTEHK